MGVTSAVLHRAHNKSWPRVHLVYFLLALFDLLAVASGLYLSHQLIYVFEDNVSANARWDARAASSATIVELSAEANAAVISAFDAVDSKLARDYFKSKTYELRQELKSFESTVDKQFPATIVRRTRALLNKIESAMKLIEYDAQRVFDRLDAGDRSPARKAMAELQRHYTNMRFHVKDLNRLVGMVKLGNVEKNRSVVADLRVYEYAIGGMIALMVLLIVVYGHWIGRLMRRKYEELQAAQTESEAFASRLQTVNEDVTKLNLELAGNMQKLKDAQDEIIRRGKLAQLGQLTATVAHELRNPLSSVRTSTYVLERKIRGKGFGVGPQLDRIAKGVMRCDHIITQLLDFTHSTAPRLESVEFDAWLAELVKEETRKLPPEVAIECRLGLGGLTLMIDAKRMSRAMANLLGNAADAVIGDGKDGARFAAKEPRIVVSTRLSARGVEVTVSDNGPGIPPENLSHIFEPLFTTKSFGAGLGLPAVQKVLEQHGGGIEVRSPAGEGASFTAWLPASRAVQAAAA
jgi:signal transduction histidine kinase